MVVKSQLKLIKSLTQKKYRQQHKLFVAEGIKMVQELLNSDLKPYKIYATSTEALHVAEGVVELISEEELKKMSTLNTPNKVLGIFYIPSPKPVEYSDWVVALDDVRDPGNLGTIIRLCDWFGIRHLVCSGTTVDGYNPKVLQATMGSIARVNMVYTDLPVFLKNAPLPAFGTFMNGANLYENKLPAKGILVMGNEANGISKEIEAIVQKRISIPQFGAPTAESLNVATATAIVLSELKRSAIQT
jgi:TrmH family RNA methyltransferase